jgi:hypothetical protein
MYTQGYLCPTWDINQFKQLEYKLDYHKDTSLIDDYVSSGHERNCIHLYNCFEDKLKLDTSYIRDHFKWVSNLALAVNLFTPGQYLPMHKDRYQRYKSVFNTDSNDDIIRIILMLEDSHVGQLLQIEDSAIAKWSAGDWFGWTGSENHAFYNFSMTNRYAIQLTGILC